MQAAAKRYKVTGSGKVMRRKPGKQHINEKMSPGHLKRLGKETQVRLKQDIAVPKGAAGCLHRCKARIWQARARC
jgi:ribosomal protein L35